MSSATESRIKAIVAEYDLEVQSRCEELESLNDRLKNSMRNEFRVQLMKLPTAIR